MNWLKNFLMKTNIDKYELNGLNKEFYTLTAKVESIQLKSGNEHKTVVLEKKSLNIEIDDLPFGCTMTFDMQDLENLICLLQRIREKHHEQI
jgi:hypothetical protein